MSVLVLADHDNAALKPATRNAVAAALKMGGPVEILVAGAGIAAVAAEAATIAGVAKVLAADDASLGHALPENLASLIVKLAPGYTHIVSAATATGKNAMPRAAALLDTMQISEIVEVVSPDTFVRPIYAGNALATVQSKDAIKIVTVRATAFAAAASGGSAPIEAVAGAADSGLARFVKQELSKSERPELTAAKIVVSGGRGMASGENFKIRVRSSIWPACRLPRPSLRSTRTKKRRSSRSRITAWWAICSNSCPNSPPPCRRANSSRNRGQRP